MISLFRFIMKNINNLKADEWNEKKDEWMITSLLDEAGESGMTGLLDCWVKHKQR